MTAVRQTSGRDEFDALWALVLSLHLRSHFSAIDGGAVIALADAAAVITDLTVLRNAVQALRTRVNNEVLGRDPLTALLADVADIRAKFAADVIDLAAVRTAELLIADRVNNALKARIPLVALLADVADIRTKFTNDVADMVTLIRRHERSAVGWADIDNGSTAGKLKTTAAVDFRIGGTLYNKAATDDLWDLSAEIDTAGDKYRAYYLYVDSSGTATFEAGTDEDTANAAIAALPALPATKSVIGVFVAGLACDFNAGGGLAAQGTIYNGFPTAQTLAAAAPAAATATATNGIANGTTAGTLRTQADVEYQIAGKVYRKADTDDLWDLSGEVDTIADEYRAYWLYLDTAGTATIAAGANAASANAAIAALPAEDAAKCPIGVYVAGAITDFDAGGGLAAQGDIHDGRPAAVADPAAITATAPAAATADVTLGIGNGTTAGKLRINADVEFQIDGKLYRKADTNDLWDLTTEVDTIAAQYRAYWLYLDAAGTATIAAGANAASASLAIAALPAETATKCPVGVYVAGPETDFDDVGGLAAQGDIHDGRAAAVAAPASMTTAGLGGVSISDGTTAGKLQLDNDTAFVIDGTVYSKAATDDLWDLSALTDLGAGEYQAAWLLLDSAGAATIDEGTAQTTAALALAVLPALDGTKSIIGVYVADPSIDWDDAGGLEAQGTVYGGIPDGAAIGGGRTGFSLATRTVVRA